MARRDRAIARLDPRRDRLGVESTHERGPGPDSGRLRAPGHRRPGAAGGGHARRGPGRGRAQPHHPGGGGRRFALPVIISEQYPRGLGRTTAAVAGAFEPVKGVCYFEKIEFAATSALAWREAVTGMERRTWLVAGMETHVCVYQTVRALRAAGHAVHVLADAVASRTPANWQNGLDLGARTGAVVTNTETVVFDLLGRAGTDDFKLLSRLVK
ncbi:MAG: isochorismatase family protein [Kofleriaceae bacterium]|nr:isochorismatase family protein [Kofleriaceae bacterium]